MSANKDRAPRSGFYAAPAFYKHPPASLLPMPKFKECPSSVSSASSESDKSSSESQSRNKEDNEAQAGSERKQNQTPENLDCRQSQPSNSDDTEHKTGKVSIRDEPKEMFDIQDRRSSISANVHLKEQRRPQLESHKLPEHDRAKQREISQQRLNEIKETVEETGAEVAGEAVGEDDKEDDEDLASTEQVEAEIDRYEHNHREVTQPNSFQVASFLEKLFESTEQTALDDGSEAAEEEAEEIWEVEQGAQVIVAYLIFEDEGYFSMQD